VESLEHAKNRKARIYCHVSGYGITSDAYHITSPRPDSEGQLDAIRCALDMAGISTDEIDYVNAHGTGTPTNDRTETIAIKLAMGEEAYRVPISSSKSMFGHLLGAAGAVEAIVCVKAIENDFIPATIGLSVPDEECDLDYVPGSGRNAKIAYAMSNSLGFGGHNATLIFKNMEV
jgi:3-oxoacyl-[acyl-carrier-protein] synthase II